MHTVNAWVAHEPHLPFGSLLQLMAFLQHYFGHFSLCKACSSKMTPHTQPKWRCLPAASLQESAEGSSSLLLQLLAPASSTACRTIARQACLLQHRVCKAIEHPQ